MTPDDLTAARLAALASARERLEAKAVGRRHALKVRPCGGCRRLLHSRPGAKKGTLPMLPPRPWEKVLGVWYCERCFKDASKASTKGRAKG